MMPLIMIIFGYLMWKHHPKKISLIFGYRTAHSMRNLETWNFANEYCGKLWVIVGSITLAVTLLIFIPYMKSMNSTTSLIPLITIAAQAIIFVVAIFPTEIALRKKFD